MKPIDEVEEGIDIEMSSSGNEESSADNESTQSVKHGYHKDKTRLGNPKNKVLTEFFKSHPELLINAASKLTDIQAKRNNKDIINGIRAQFQRGTMIPRTTSTATLSSVISPDQLSPADLENQLVDFIKIIVKNDWVKLLDLLVTTDDNNTKTINWIHIGLIILGYIIGQYFKLPLPIKPAED